MKLTKLKQVLDETSLSSDTLTSDHIPLQNDLNKNFTFDIPRFDEYLLLVKENTEASQSQVINIALSYFGFLASHSGIFDTNVNAFDFSRSGNNKSRNIGFQWDLLMPSHLKMQESKNLICEDDKDAKFINAYREVITVPALFEHLKSEPAQLIVCDEIGLQFQKDDSLITQLTKMYGQRKVAAPFLKHENNKKAMYDCRLNFIAATTFQYLGGSAKFIHHLAGGFLSRAIICFNNELRDPSTLKIIKPFREYDKFNKLAFDYYTLLKESESEIYRSDSVLEIELEFIKENETIFNKFSEMGLDELGLLYKRLSLNTKLIANVLHCLYCFDKGAWEKDIREEVVIKSIEYSKQVLYKEIEKVIDHITDGELISREEKQMKRVLDCFQKHVDEFSSLPDARYVQQYTKLKKIEQLELLKGYAELIPGTNKYKYCERF